MVHANDDDFETDVYVKPTNLGRCMNAEGDCTDSYKQGVIRSYVRRALKHCSTWQLVDRELRRIKQMLVNNGYRNGDIDEKDEKAIRDIVTKNVTPVQPDYRIRLKIYYKTPRTSSLIMRNNQQNMTTLQETNVVNRFQCTTGDCATRNVYYIGLTTTSLSRRLTMHLQDGGPKTHLHDHRYATY